jgi:hypothetical protein
MVTLVTVDIPVDDVVVLSGRVEVSVVVRQLVVSVELTWMVEELTERASAD